MIVRFCELLYRILDLNTNQVLNQESRLKRGGGVLAGGVSAGVFSHRRKKVRAGATLCGSNFVTFIKVIAIQKRSLFDHIPYLSQSLNNYLISA